MDDKIKSLIQAYSCETPDKIKPKVVDLKISKKKKSSSPTKPKKLLDKSLYKDLPPSLKPDLTIIFVGFNPGLQSSLTQHHYAHFSNLFWKLFNQSRLIYSVVDVETAVEKKDTFIQSRTTGQEFSKFTAADDYDLLDYGIGFTDMVLRCTKAIDELTEAEKLENVPRLFDELKVAKPKFLCFIGKGIWEIIVNYLNGSKNFKLKDFKWGVQNINEAVGDYRRLLLSLQKHLGYDDYCLYIFPNTSGLVTSLKFHEKLELWNDLVKDIYSKKT